MMLNTTAGRLDSADIDEYRQLVQPWELNLRQISPGRFRARMDYAQVNGILIYRVHCARHVMGMGSTPRGYVMFGSPSSPKHNIGWCGQEVGTERLAFGRSSAEADFVLPEDSLHVVVLVPEDKLLGYLGGEPTKKLYLTERHRIRCSAILGNALVATIHHLLDDVLAKPEWLADATLCNALEWQLLGRLVQALHAEHPAAESKPPGKRRAALLRAVDYAEHLDRPIGGSELAAVAGVSQRLLELSFNEMLGISPARFLRWNRMNRVRSELIAADPGAALVKHIVARFGFTEMGRFAVEYKGLFGESPSETLARKASKPPARLADILSRAVAN